MQLATVFTLLTATASVAASWEFKGWSDSDYLGNLLIHATGGLSDNVCIDITMGNNQMSSFKWNHGSNNPCRFKLYNGLGCNGLVLYGSMLSMSRINMPVNKDNKASSLGIDCFTF